MAFIGRKILVGFVFSGVALSAQAGLIVGDKEWELRGSLTNVAGHIAEAALDTGWMWATLDDWFASGLNGVRIDQPDVDAFEGVCDGTGEVCDAHLNSSKQQFHFEIICSQCAESVGFVFETWTSAPSNQSKLFYRVAYRDVTVPEPGTLGLIGMGVLGLLRARRFGKAR